MMPRFMLLAFLMVILSGACQPVEAGSTPMPEPVTKGVMLEPEGFIQRIHDPVIAHENETYYVYSTGSLVPFICSRDKVVWEFCGRVFERIPAWTREINPNLVDVWAPDISFFEGRWHLYYAVSS